MVRLSPASLGFLLSTVLISIGPACGADLMPYKAPAVPRAAAFSWSGWYVGLNAGATWGDADVNWIGHQGSAAVNAQIAQFSPAALHASGFTGGGQVGFNYQFGAFVAGAEADIQYTDFRASNAVTYTGVLLGAPDNIVETASSRWLATVRPRLGIAAGPWLFYGTGGLAVGKVAYSDYELFTNNGQVFTASSSDVKAGVAGGGGVEFAMAPNWSVKAEYLYVDLGSTTYTSQGSLSMNTIEHHHAFHEQIARVGLNYRFAGP